MKEYSLPNNDNIPALGLGTWKSAPGEVGQAVKTALDIGYRHIDCAPIYENEAEIGRALQEACSKIPREKIWITSKLWNDAHRADAVEPALRKTLSDLKLDYLDLYLIHWPVHLKRGTAFPKSVEEILPYREIPLTETWGALESCVEKGLVRHLGVSNFGVSRLREVLALSKIKPVVNQVEAHPYLQQNELLDFCTKHNMLLTAYSPLGSKDRPSMLKKADEPSLLDQPVVRAVAEKHAATPAQVLISWAVTRGTIVIPKSVNPLRIKENFEAAKLTLDPADMQELAGLERGYRFVDGGIWALPGSPYTLQELWA